MTIDNDNFRVFPKPEREYIIRRTFLTGIAVALLTGCVPGESRGDSASSPTWNVRMSADTINIDVPAGWVRSDLEDHVTPLYIIQEGHQDIRSRSAPGIRASYESPGTHLSIYSPPPMPDLDIGSRRDSSMEGGIRNDYITDAEVLPDRTIGGSPAYGYTGVFTFDDGIKRPAQKWLIWREDGMWYIKVVGFDDEIPPELLAALDTITWTIPAPTAAPATPTAAPS